MGTVIAAVLILLLALAFIAAFRTAVRRTARGCCGTDDGRVKSIPPADRKIAHYPYRYQVAIEGMTCPNCNKSVENAFHSREGFLACADYRKGVVTVYAKSPVSPEKLREFVRSAGYSAGAVTEGTGE